MQIDTSYDALLYSEFCNRDAHLHGSFTTPGRISKTDRSCSAVDIWILCNCKIQVVKYMPCFPKSVHFALYMKLQRESAASSIHVIWIATSQPCIHKKLNCTSFHGYTTAIKWTIVILIFQFFFCYIHWILQDQAKFDGKKLLQEDFFFLKKGFPALFQWNKAYKIQRFKVQWH